MREAYAKRFEQGATNKAELAAKIGCDRSLITRRLNGGENMTIKTIADLAWALGHCVEVEITDAEQRSGRNDAVYDPQNVPALQATSITTLAAGAWAKAIPATSPIIRTAQLSQAVG